MKLPCLKALAAGLLLALSAPLAHGQDYPTRTVTVVVPWPPGGLVDAIGRIVGERMATALGRPVVIENKPGAASKIGTDMVAKAAPDGHTLLVASSAHSTNAALSASLPFDPVDDFTPVVFAAQTSSVLIASRSVPADNLRDLLALAKTKPGGLSYGSAGVGTPAHLLGEYFAQAIGTELLHVPYRGAPQAVNDLIAGRVDLFFANLNVSVPPIEAGQVKAIGATSPERVPELPNVPTLSESGLPGFESVQWLAILGPKGMKPEVVAKLNAVINDALSDPEVRRKLATQGMSVVGGSPDAVSPMIAADIARWKGVVGKAGLKLE